MNWKQFALVSTVALSMLGCSLKDGSTVSPTVSAQVDQSIANQSSQVADAQAQQLMQGQPVTVTFAAKTANIQVQQDSVQNPVIAVTASDSVTTYFKKSTGAVASLRKVDSLAQFLQGAWVAFAQLKGGVWFELIVDSNNQLTMNITNTTQGIQVDVKVQGTPSAEAVKNAEIKFAAWQAGVATSSSTVVASSSSINLASSTSLSSIANASSSSTKIVLSSSAALSSNALSSNALSSIAQSSSSVKNSSANVVSSSSFALSSSNITVSSSATQVSSSVVSSSVSAQQYATNMYGKMIEMSMISSGSVTSPMTGVDIPNAVAFGYNGITYMISTASNGAGYTTTFYKSTAQATKCTYIDADKDVWNTPNSDNDASFSVCVKALVAPVALN